MPPKRMTSGDWAQWAGVVSVVVIALCGVVFTYGKFTSQLEDLPQIKKDISEMRVDIAELKAASLAKQRVASVQTNKDFGN